MAKFITVEELLASPNADQITEEVEIAGLGTVKICAFSKAMHSRMMREAQPKGGGDLDLEKFEALALVNGLAEPKLTLEQAQQLREKRWGAVQELLNHVWDLSGMNRFGGVTARAVEEAEESFRK